METLLVDRADGIVTVTLNRPEKRNAVNSRMWDELRATFDEVGHSPDDRVMVVTGAGSAFCSGADLTDGPGRDGDRLGYMRKVGAVALALHRIPKPTIAKVRGVAVGAGWNLALGCDLVVSSDNARYSQIFAQRGLVIDFGGSWLLPRLVGMQKAKELALFADFVSAEEAHTMGLCNRVVPDGELDAFVDSWANRLAAGPPLALSMSKTLLGHGIATSLEQAVEDEARCQAVCLTSEDTREAQRAFLEKRAPEFSGR
jgi:2-(1,2-epoxy-1,2-dihydrophenyl)acetyl-CoA isomerase